MPFARDRIVESYFWALGVYFEPEFAFTRKFLTKITAFTVIADDMYDVYGTWKDLEAYTEALQKWDDVAMEGLPDYTQLHYRAILSVYREAEKELAGRGRLYCLPYTIQSMKDQAARYLAEAKWFFQNYTPTLDEYIVLVSLSSGYPMLVIKSLVGMGDVVTEEAFKWASDNPQMLRASAIVARLVDDNVGHKFEHERGHVASSIHCLVKQYRCTEQEVEEMLRKWIFNSWKAINEACLKPLTVPMPIMERNLNVMRSLSVVTHSTTMMKDVVTHLLVNPLPL